MRFIQRLFLLTCVSMAAVQVHADHLATELRANVDAFAIPPIDDRTPTSVVFAGTPVIVEVAVSAAAVPDATRAVPGNLKLPGKQWWDHLVWEVRKDGEEGRVTGFRAVSFHQQMDNRKGGEDESILYPNQRAVARFRIEGLGPGTYRLHVRLGNLKSADDWFLVSTGTENDHLRREHARYRVLYASRDQAALKANLLDLAGHDPQNAWPWIRLGDISLEHGSLEEIRGYYDRALQILAAREKTFRADGNVAAADAVIDRRDTIRGFRELLPSYIAQRNTMEVTAGDWGYVLKDRRTGRIIRTIGKVPPAMR